MSERSAYRWLGRYRSGTISSTIAVQPPHLPASAEHVAASSICAAKRRTGPLIAQALGIARSTVSLVLRLLGLNRLDRLEPKLPVIRYQRERPAGMIHLDIKKLGNINGIDYRFAPRGPGMHANKGHRWTSCMLDR